MDRQRGMLLPITKCIENKTDQSGVLQKCSQRAGGLCPVWSPLPGSCCIYLQKQQLIFHWIETWFCQHWIGWSIVLFLFDWRLFDRLACWPWCFVELCFFLIINCFLFFFLLLFLNCTEDCGVVFKYDAYRLCFCIWLQILFPEQKEREL